MKETIIKTGEEAIHTASLCNEISSKVFLMENIRRLAYLLKKAIQELKESLSKEYVYVIYSLCDTTRDRAETYFVASTKNRQKAHEILLRKVEDYIDTWHDGDENELKSKEAYLQDGFNTETIIQTELDEPHKVESWILNEDDTYFEIAIMKMKID